MVNATGKMIKVLLVDDQTLVLTILTRMLANQPGMQLVGTASNGREALELIPRLEPDVICTDLHMPVMDGLEFTRQVMERYPRPILVISASVHAGEDAQNIFRLLEAGAVDILSKPVGGVDSQDQVFAGQLAQKIRVLAGVKIIRRRFSVAAPAAAAPGLGPAPLPELQQPVRLVAVGASTGGPQALQAILSPLQRDFPAPILCVQHISQGFLQGLVDWLGSKCRLKVQIAQTGLSPQPGTAYFAPEQRHLQLNALGRLVNAGETARGVHCPSIDVTFASVAQYYGSSALGILLTGMGRDGAEGLLAISRAGGLTLAQDEASSVVFGMPKEAIALGAVRHVLSLDGISAALLRLKQP